MSWLRVLVLSLTSCKSESTETVVRSGHQGQADQKTACNFELLVEGRRGCLWAREGLEELASSQAMRPATARRDAAPPPECTRFKV